MGFFSYSLFLKIVVADGVWLYNVEDSVVGLEPVGVCRGFRFVGNASDSSCGKKLFLSLNLILEVLDSQ